MPADFDYVVTAESLLTLKEVSVGEEFCGVTVDVKGLVEEVPFVIFVTYKDRSVPPHLYNPSVVKSGAIEMNVNNLPRLFGQVQSGEYKSFLRSYLEDETEGKSWIYHPREQKLKDQALARRDAWLEEQVELASQKASQNRRLQRACASAKSSLPVHENRTLDHAAASFRCIMCGSSWSGESKECKECNTHLFTTTKF